VVANTYEVGNSITICGRPG